MKHRQLHVFPSSKYTVAIIEKRNEFKMKAFWDIARRGLIGVDRRFRGAYFLYHKGDTLMMEAVL
jgi:hypothetical protein